MKGSQEAPHSRAAKAFAEASAKARRLLDQADVDETETRYRVGAIVARLRDEPGTYGARGVERLAEDLRRDAATLYRYASVADLGSWRELQSVFRQKDSAGHHLSWSHLVELARVRSAWRAWLDKTLREAWSASDLAREIQAAGRSSGKSDAAVDTTTAALAESLRGVRRFGGEVTHGLEAVLERIERDPAKERAKDVPALLARALDLVEDAHEKTGALAARIRRLASPTDPVHPPPRASRSEQ
jgi:hypothetical protein